MLRGVAALSVAIPHFIMRSAGGGVAELVSSVAVEVFFALSGFVLAPQIMRLYQTRSLDDLWVFLRRRWMRTIPPFLIALAMASILFRPVVPADIIKYALYVQNLTGPALTTDYFPIAWSLSVEEWFYLTFPALLMVFSTLSGQPKPRKALLCGAAFILVVTIARSVAAPADWSAEIRRVVDYRVDAIAFGFLLGASGMSLKRSSYLLLAWAASAAATVVSLYCSPSSGLARATFPIVAPTFGCLCVELCLRAEAMFANRPALELIAEVLGRLSYPIYLFHLVVIYLLPASSGLIGFMVATGALAATSAYLIEKPILDMRPRYGALSGAQAVAAGITT
jgi:peptidoglycan/LPS O-acetylase OafA/YrhL